MVTGNITTQVKASSTENAKKIGAIFNNIATQVAEQDLMSFYQTIRKDPRFLSKIIKKLDNPLVKNLIR